MYLFCGLFLWLFLDYIASNGGMIDEWRIGNDLEGSGGGLIEMLFRNFARGTEDNHENMQSGCPDSNQAPSEYSPKVLSTFSVKPCICLHVACPNVFNGSDSNFVWEVCTKSCGGRCNFDPYRCIITPNLQEAQFNFVRFMKKRGKLVKSDKECVTKNKILRKSKPYFKHFSIWCTCSRI
jgi:hypothetical protein